MGLMISVSGIRGIVGVDLTPKVIVDYVAAFITILNKPRGKIVIGKDTRSSGNLIEKIVSATIMAMGYDVLNIGIATTPTVLLSTRKMDLDGGIAITASHNSQEWNALKFCNNKGLFLNEEYIKKIEKRVKKCNFNWKKHDKLGLELNKINCTSIHINEVLKLIDVEKITEKQFKVAIDPVGNTATAIDREFLETLGCRVVSINEKPTSVFPREPEPVPENLKELCDLVKRENADIGFAQDPDGDRLSVVSEKGEAIGEEYTLVLSTESYLRKNKTNIACNLSTSQMIDDLAKRHEVKVYRTKIGEINVTSKMLEEGLQVGGEGNGGIIVPEINACRDSIVGMGLILELMAKTQKTVSQTISEFPHYKMKKIKLDISKQDKVEIYKKILSRAKKSFLNYEIDTRDGIKVYNDKEWLHIRLSNTEPVTRIMIEAKDDNRVNKLLHMAKSFLD